MYPLYTQSEQKILPLLGPGEVVLPKVKQLDNPATTEFYGVILGQIGEFAAEEEFKE